MREIFEKWDLPCAEIGTVTDDGMMRVRNNGSVAAEIPAKPAGRRSAAYTNAKQEADRGSRCTDLRQDMSGYPSNPRLLLRRACSHDPTIASKNWVYRQYDHMVRTGTVVMPGRMPPFSISERRTRFLPPTTDCNSLYCALDPREGGRIAVAEAARNLTCSGAVRLPSTDNLNFGNPYKPENFWQLRECGRGTGRSLPRFRHACYRRECLAL